MNTAKQLHSENCTISDKLSDIYAPVSTELLLKPFFNRGWFQVSTKKNRSNSKDWTTLEHSEYKFLNGDSIRIEVLNSYNGSTALMIMGGLGRIVCSNGLVIGKDFESFRFVHRGTSIYDRIDNAYDKIIVKLDELKNKINVMKDYNPTSMEIRTVIDNVFRRMIDSDSPKLTKRFVSICSLHNIITPRREADTEKDAFTVLNVIQENLVRNGYFDYYVQETNKETGEQITKISTKRATEGKLSSLKLNEVITDEFLKLVA